MAKKTGRSGPGFFGGSATWLKDRNGAFVSMMIGGWIMARFMTSRPGLCGSTLLFDEYGRLIGEGRPGLAGTVDYFDAGGRYIGQSLPSLMGETVYVDSGGRYSGCSRPGALDTEIYMDDEGCYAGETYPGIMGERLTRLEDE